MNTARLILYTIWFGILVFALALAIYTKLAFRHPTKHHAVTTAVTGITAPSEGQTKVMVALPDYKQGKLTLKEEEQTVPPRAHPLRTAIETLVEKAPQFPRGTKVLGVNLRDGLATIDFNDALQSGMGDDEEQAVLESLRKTAGQFKTVDKVQILVNGKPVDTLGHSEEAAQPMNVLR